jgi:tyrosyl-tRNA synthetase
MVRAIMSSSPTNALLDELRWRGLLHQTTHPDELAEALSAGPVRVYGGFDPTADSLTIGNLVPIMVLKHLQLAGHAPWVVMGGGTGLIGDPSGKSVERQLLDRETISQNVQSQRRIFESLLSFEGEAAATIVNNADWLVELGYVEVLRDVGKHFSVNMMIQKDSVRERLHNREQGISYTEFSYMLLQAYDFLHLFRHHGVSVQLGGSDQWGNITAGVDLIRRVEQGDAFGFTTPLITKADGSKFGKSESGAIWLTPELTSPYAYYQFWFNATDADVERFLKMFTLLDRAAIESLLEQHAADPGKRLAQRTLARETTRLLHGEHGLGAAEAASEALFSGQVSDLAEDVLTDVFRDAPSSEHSLSELDPDGLSLVDLLPQTTLCKSKREARQFLETGAVQCNGKPAGLDTRLGKGDLLHGKVALLRRGKRSWHVARFGAAAGT